MTVSIIHRQNQMIYAKNYINFSTIKKWEMLEKDSAKRRSNVITQWIMTNHMLLRLYYTTGAQSIFPGVYGSIYPSLWPTYAMIILIEWRINPISIWYTKYFSYIHRKNSHIRVYMNIEQYEVCTLAVDGWAVTFGTAMRGLGGATARSGPTSLYQM